MLSGHFRLRQMQPSAPPLPDPRFATDSHGMEFERGRSGQGTGPRVAFVAAIHFVFFGWSLIVAFNGEPILGALCAFLWLEYALMVIRLQSLVGGPVEDALLAARVGAIVSDVRGRLGCDLPRISLRNDTRRIAAVVQRGKRPLLTLSRPFIATLSDDELRGIVAHEMAHMALGDLTTARVMALFTGAAAPALLLIGVALLGHHDALGQPPIFGGLWSVAALVTTVAVSPWSRRRELRADAYAASLTRNPGALASALMKGDVATDAAPRRLLGRPPLRWALLPVAWRVPTHPRLVQRAERLREWSPATAADLTALRAPAAPARWVMITAWSTVLCAVALVVATLLPWVTETDPTMPYLSWTELGVSSYGWLVLVGALLVATIAALTGMRLRRDARVGLGLTGLGFAWGCAGVIVARAHELAGFVADGDGTFSYTFAAGFVVAGVVTALLVAASTALFIAALLAKPGARTRQIASSSF